MRCSTCGESILAGEDRCPTCGAVVERRRRAPVMKRNVRQCARCGHHSEGVPYFRKTGHLALLVGLSVFTYGVGGLVYYARCRKRQVCPNCGLAWEHSRVPGDPEGWDAGSGVPAPVTSMTPASPPSRDKPLPPSGIGRRVFGAGLGVMATLIITAGIAGGMDGPPIVIGAFLGMGGSGMFLWGWRALQERRQAVLQILNRKVLQLATQRGGVLTVTEVAAELDLSLEAAEKLMIGMDDGFRVRSDISDEGVIYYEFPEVVHQKKLRSGKPA
ncbi:MAG: hypothetical protein OXK77_01140 [Gemmatimonadota bacterium]|nr:hypothetical protein [Gemmatimonadota bacterium]MDE2866142.1 hypothetical protein [Gemmatimonadota bacterium]MYB05597.1 hypothetical protein [Gemmatimonadota bacterium]MYE18230.1 hypothetical protein [Gemmatimonadota bacterium]MYG22805.1 hypothetical protein [Gemmatimonadota bacterium]